MARELPIRNGRLTTDLDAAGHRIKNLPPGEGFTQAQADWNQSDSTKPDFIKNKPTIPAPVTVDSALSGTSTNPVQNKVVTAALAARPTKAQIDAGWWSEWTFSGTAPQTGWSVVWVSDNIGWSLFDGDITVTSNYTAFPTGNQDGSERIVFDNGVTAVRHRVAAPVPTKTSDLTNDGSDGEHPFISQNEVQHQQLTPVYSQTPTFGEWSFSGLPSGITVTLFDYLGNNWWRIILSNGGHADVNGTANDTTIHISTEDWMEYGDYDVTATRERTDIIGYTLGDQTTKPLQPQGN